MGQDASRCAAAAVAAASVAFPPSPPVVAPPFAAAAAVAGGVGVIIMLCCWLVLLLLVVLRQLRQQLCLDILQVKLYQLGAWQLRENSWAIVGTVHVQASDVLAMQLQVLWEAHAATLTPCATVAVDAVVVHELNAAGGCCCCLAPALRTRAQLPRRCGSGTCCRISTST